MSGGRPCGLPSNERWLADVSYLGTPPLGSDYAYITSIYETHTRNQGW